MRKGVFIPAFAVMAVVVTVGFVNNEGLAKGAKAFFGFSLGKFGWLYQLVAVISVLVIAIVTFSKLGDIRIGRCKTEISIRNLVCHDAHRRNRCGNSELGNQRAPDLLRKCIW